MPKSDVVIIGSGLAALVAASRLCMDKNVIIFTKSNKRHSNSMLAQGGVASSVDQEDSWFSHYQDTLVAGCNHNEEDAVRQLVRNGPLYINEMIKCGMKFDRDNTGNLLLGHEGAHSYRRILHAGGDATGEALISFLLGRLKENCSIIEHHMAIDLIMDDGLCRGVNALDEDNNLVTYNADYVILATGGCGAIYEYTSNDSSVIGDGYAMAFRAGAELLDMEFVQFHPTLLKSNGLAVGLVSEAVRGEGAVLRLGNGLPIMEGIHPLLDLAPRDIVSRAIYNELKNGKDVFLDISMIQNFKERFPTISKLCSENGISIEEGKLPVVPGAHFMMGGIKVNEMSETNIPGLYAVGEVACTRVHGANRLASNSLLEGIVFANRLADSILDGNKPRINKNHDKLNVEQAPNYVEFFSKQDIQKLMMKHVGIVRNREGLEELIRQFEPHVHYKINSSWSKESISRMNMITTGWLIASSALRREESRGGHYREDIPIQKKEWIKKVIVRNRYEVVLS
ncbi:L-aspartate oxidase [Bacillus suaedaesalsae]|uniref:L-aspartate oxidase n=1 Tax=Bacillus suaedaesalsae TaxID=2810349 RepID=A0ABS2DML1_9BACI|nr:L-aspartate oxidase [Bacillus suaedaesalsae]MBM6619731.1 L-aspartate oxidase [Bacillus suaedaesalsae]